MIILGCVAGSLAAVLTVLLLVFGESTGIQSKTAHMPDEVVVPATWKTSYIESAEDYEEYVASMDAINWDIVEAEPEQTVNYSTNAESTASISVFASAPLVGSQTDNDVYLAQLSESDAWTLITGGRINSYPTNSYAYYANLLQDLRNENTETITISAWYWEDPTDDTNFNKITVEKTFAVNSVLADTFRHIFQDIYNDPSQPVINVADRGMGTWVLRGKNHNSSSTMSAHSLGCAIDINPSTGSFFVNGSWYGNGYKQRTMSGAMWTLLPECHAKYHVLYDGCPIVEVFKSYGFYWGGDWTSGTDCMHLSYIGDGSNARSIGTQNFLERR